MPRTPSIESVRMVLMLVRTMSLRTGGGRKELLRSLKILSVVGWPANEAGHLTLLRQFATADLQPFANRNRGCIPSWPLREHRFSSRDPSDTPLHLRSR